MMCCKKVVRTDFGHITASWKFYPEEPSRYQCTIIIWGTVFTNDFCCCSRLVGSISKVWQPFTSCLVTRNMSDINLNDTMKNKKNPDTKYTITISIFSSWLYTHLLNKSSKWKPFIAAASHQRLGSVPTIKNGHPSHLPLPKCQAELMPAKFMNT